MLSLKRTRVAARPAMTTKMIQVMMTARGLAMLNRRSGVEPTECTRTVRFPSRRRSMMTTSAGSTNTTQTRKTRMPLPVRNPSCVIPRKSVARNA